MHIGKCKAFQANFFRKSHDLLQQGWAHSRGGGGGRAGSLYATPPAPPLPGF